MSLPLIVNNSLFWNYKGEILSSWYLCGDGSTDDMREAHVQWCLKNKCNTVLICLNNEDMMSLFKKAFMGPLDDNKCTTLANYVMRIRAAGLMVAFAFYDGPAIPSGKYHPILDCPEELHAYFIKAVCDAFNPYVSLYLIGCETNRYWSSDKVEQFVYHTKQCAGPGHFVGTHEQGVGMRNGKWVMTRRVPVNADFHCHEMSNDPHNGDSGSVADMVNEVRFLVSQANGIPIWVGEFNLNAGGSISRAQARALTALPGVIGVGGPR